jgi:hypothetical protein
MAKIPITRVGTIGVVKDLADQFLPLQAWTDAKNVRMRDVGVYRIEGERQVFGTPTVPPKWAMAVPGNAEYFWLYSDMDKVYVWNGTVHTDITKVATTYTGTDLDLWTGTLLGGVPILNNGAEVPQFWSNLSTAQRLTDLTNWPAGVTARALRAFGPYLLALNVTKSGTNFPNMVKWSHPADPGAVPSSWDETDETKDAGEVELTDVFAGGLVDGVALGGVFIVYKENSTHILRSINNRFIFDFDPLFPASGVLGIHCAREIPTKSQIFLATGDDIIIHGIQRGEIQSVLDSRARRFLLNDMDIPNRGRSFVVSNERQKEMWFCYPESGGTWPTKALIWDYSINTITFRDLNTVSFIASGIVEETSSPSYDASSDTYDSITGSYHAGVVGAEEQNLLMCLPDATELRKADVADDFDGVAISAHAERTGLTVIGVDRQGQPIVDLQTIKLISRVWIRATGAPFNVRVGAQEEEDGTIIWSSTETFTPGTDKFVDFTEPVSGRIIAVRVESTGGANWTVEGYDLIVEPLGEF